MKYGDLIKCIKTHKVYGHVWELGEIYKAMGSPYMIENRTTVMIAIDENRYDFGLSKYFEIVEEDD